MSGAFLARTLSARLQKLGTPRWRSQLGDAIAAAPAPEEAAAAFERLAEAGGEQSLLSWPCQQLARFAVVLGASPALVRYLVAQGVGWPEAALRYNARNPDEVELARLGGLAAAGSLEDLGRRLRALAACEMYRIGARDLLGLADFAETVEAITRLAEVCLNHALRFLRSLLACQEGDTLRADGSPVGFVVLGLGKLGGAELNYSSDIDLLYLYDDLTAGDAAAATRFFARLAADLTRLIGERTAEGIVFRVDLRLRPEGVNGPLINSVTNARAYYEGWGDTWERGALAKARPVAGDLDLGRRFIDEIRPFIYRRHLDYQTIEDFRRMKERIDAERAGQAADLRDVKLGRGGIRELEFVVQVLQLIHGGHEPAVRCTSTLDAINALERQGFLAPSQAARLSRAYVFLRNVEHAVQIVERQQTQQLPAEQAGLRRLARSLGYGSGRRGAPRGVDEATLFERDWRDHSSAVHEAFVRFLELRVDQHAGAVESSASRALAVLSQLERGAEAQAAALLEDMGFPDGRRAAYTLARLYRGRLKSPPSPQRRRAVESMAPALLGAVLASADAERALEGLVEFLIRSGAHTSYLALLSGSPATMEILVALFAGSPFLAGHLAGHPELLDSLVRSDAAGPGGNAGALRETLSVQLRDVDWEGALAALRRFRTAELLRIGMNDLSGVICAEEVHAQLSSLAEVCLCAAAGVAARLLTPDSGDDASMLPDLAIVALGKMGAREMSYGSDLDLLFVYDSGSQGFDAEQHTLATRWVQRTIALLQARTADGIVYRIDARLRPSGRSGPLVTSLERFVAYHTKEAALWERQAHIRARVVYGPEHLASTVHAVIERFVYEPGLGLPGIEEIHRLRERVERELAAEKLGRANIKTGRGGIVDIEFLVQMLQLRHGKTRPQLRCRSTLAAIAALRQAGVFSSRDTKRLAEVYGFLRHLESRLRLERDRPVEELGADPCVLTALAKRLGFAGPDPGTQLLRRYQKVTEEVRKLYEQTFERAAAGGP